MQHDQLEKENTEILEHSQKIAKFYDLKSHEQIKEITDDLLNSPLVKAQSKESIRQYRRRIFVFWYPSDGLKIKGFFSFTPHPANHPLIVLLRGGNRDWAIFNPATDLATYKNYSFISSTYRGGISEGADEFGGKDVNDVKNLIDFIPSLETFLDINLHPIHTYMVGGSRGGMQMFLTLARYPHLQNGIEKIVSLSGLLDIELHIKNREGMKKMFIEDFGLREGINEKEWIASRSALLTIPQIRKSLPILILQGSEDNRVDLEEGYHMVERLEKNGNLVTYQEIEGGLHSLSSTPNRMDIITEWLET